MSENPNLSPQTPPDSRLLTESELEIMHLIWDLGEANVRQVTDGLPAHQSRAYTTVATFLKILEEKGFLRSTKQGRTIVYAPMVSRSEYEARNLRAVVHQVFRGDGRALVRQLARMEGEFDAASLEALLDELKP